MPAGNNHLVSPQEWLARAQSNFKLAQTDKTDDIFWEDLCFNLQQAVEKAIKSVLLFKGVDFPFVHDIARLITLIKENGITWPEELDEAAELSEYAVETRYPGFFEEVSEVEYLKALEITQKVLIWAEKFVTIK
ncbi:MAG: HEPN domain-containing protein [bacterium]